jgi:hypothetical protein
MRGISDVMKREHEEMRDNYRKIIEAQDEDTAERWGNQVGFEALRCHVAEATLTRG